MAPSHYAVAKRPTCSPGNFKFTDRPITVRDDPYDTERGESFCVGKWGYALHRFAGYLTKKVQYEISEIRTLMERSGLYFADHVYDSIDVHFELEDGTQRYVIQLDEIGVWQQPRGEPRRKDAVLNAHVTVGPFYLDRLSQQFAANVEHVNLPTIALRRYGLVLRPTLRKVANEIAIVYELTSPVRLYSKHRRVDVTPGREWERYRDPASGREWEYKSGRTGRRARWSGNRSSINVDAEERSSGDDDETDTSERTATPPPRDRYISTSG